MKLFVTNKNSFELFIFDLQEFKNQECLTSNEIHKKAFNELQTSVISKNAIPIQIVVDIDEHLNLVFFEFQAKKNDVYYYEFQSV